MEIEGVLRLAGATGHLPGGHPTAFGTERWLAPLLNQVCGAATARRALRLAARLYPAGGQAQQAWSRWRFLLRAAWYASASRQWFQFLDANDHRRALARARPELAEKPHRPYRRCDLGAAGRAASLSTHILALEGLGWTPLLASLCRQPLLLATLPGKDETDRQLVLDFAGQFGKEAELCIHLTQGSKRLYTVAFSLAGGEAGLVLDIGCVQGPGGAAAAETVRSDTKALQGLRPRDLMICALRAVADAAGATGIVAVGSGRHIYRHWRKRKRVGFDYDGFWREQGGARRADGDFDLPLRRDSRPVAQLPSKKRAEARRRHDLVADGMAQIARALAAVVHGETSPMPMPMLVPAARGAEKAAGPPAAPERQAA